MSLVIYGISDRRWVVYAFDNDDLRDNDLEVEDLEDENPRYKLGYFQEDPIASDGKVDANLPIWNPREYFLLIFQVRMGRILQEWKRLVRWLERNVEEYVCQDFFTSS